MTMAAPRAITTLIATEEVKECLEIADLGEGDGEGEGEGEGEEEGEGLGEGETSLMMKAARGIMHDGS